MSHLGIFKAVLWLVQESCRAVVRKGVSLCWSALYLKAVLSLVQESCRAVVRKSFRCWFAQYLKLCSDWSRSRAGPWWGRGFLCWSASPVRASPVSLGMMASAQLSKALKYVLFVTEQRKNGLIFQRYPQRSWLWLARQVLELTSQPTPGKS